MSWRDRLRELSAPQASHVAETVDVLRYCAKKDKPYIVRYVRRKGLFCCSEAIRIDENGGQIGNYGYGETTDIMPQEMNGNAQGWCAWCGAGSQVWNGIAFGAVTCSSCGYSVCLGRTNFNRGTAHSYSYESSYSYQSDSDGRRSSSSSFNTHTMDTPLNPWFRCRDSCGHAGEVGRVAPVRGVRQQETRLLAPGNALVKRLR